jgi:hypothetical protein
MRSALWMPMLLKDNTMAQLAKKFVLVQSAMTWIGFE